MNLHTNKQLFADAVIAAAQKFKIPEIYIEKDYWVTVALHTIFHTPIAADTVFKGGTALSKCHHLIERFSEDVDLVVLNKNGESGNKLKNKIIAITDAVGTVMPEVEIEGITNKKGQIRKTAHEYNRANFQGAYGQVKEHIIVEATWLGSSDPFITAAVTCYIADLMLATGQDEMIDLYNLHPFMVKVLSKERTFCEKIMSLVRFSHTGNPYQDLSNKIRHIYDLHMMLKNTEIAAFFKSQTFFDLMLVVGKDDIISFKNNNQWLSAHPSEAIIFNKPEETWDKIKTPYRTSFKDLVIGELPNEGNLVETLKIIAERLKIIQWML
jgi:hypothetical protein